MEFVPVINTSGVAVLTFLLRILIIWWLLTILFKWMGKSLKSPTETARQTNDGNPQNDPKVIHSGTIEDADFEEMD